MAIAAVRASGRDFDEVRFVLFGEEAYAAFERAVHRG